MQRLGFIGTGGMGRPMAANLLKAGFTLTVHDARREATAPLEEKGAKVAHSPRQVAEQSDVVLSMLPVNEAVHAVAAGPGGLTETLAGARVWIDFSSVDRDTILRAEAAPLPFTALAKQLFLVGQSRGVDGYEASGIAWKVYELLHGESQMRQNNPS